MEINIAHLNKNASRSLVTHWRLVVGVTLINLLVGWLPINGWWGIIVLYFLSLPFHTGLIWFYLDIYQRESSEVSSVWDPTTESWVKSDYQHPNPLGLGAILRPFNQGFKFYLKVVGLLFFVGLFTILWSLFLVIPGIIKSISYSQALYLLRENPDIGIFEAINESRRLMRGQKKNYVLTILSWNWWDIPLIAFAIFLFWNWSGLEGTFLFLIDSFYYDVILLPLYLVFHSNIWDAIFSFLFLSYLTFFYLPYFWTLLGGFHRELMSEPVEEVLSIRKKQPIFSKVVMALTTGLVAFTLVTSDHPAFVRLRQEIGIAPRSTLLFYYSSLSEIETDSIVICIWSETRATINDSTTVVIYDDFLSMFDLFEGLPLWDTAGTGEPSVSGLSPRQIQTKVKNWLESRLAAGTAALGNLSDLNTWMRAMVIGESTDEENFADYIILFSGVNNVTSPDISPETVTFMGAVGAEGQFFDPVLNVYETYLHFPDAVFDSEALTDQLLIEWADQHQGITDYFSWVQIQLANGHQLRITNTLYGPLVLLYMQPDPSTNGWSVLYIGEAHQPPSYFVGQLAWVEIIANDIFPIFSPLGANQIKDWIIDTPDLPTVIEPPVSLQLMPVPNFTSIAEYIQWANSLEWDLSIAVTNSSGQWLNPMDLGEYTIHKVFGSYVGASDHTLWIEIRGLNEQVDWVHIPNFTSIAEYRAWLEELGWGTELFVHDTVTWEELDPNHLSRYAITTIGGGPDSGVLYPHHSHLWIGVWLGE